MVRTKPDDDDDRVLLRNIESHGWHLVGISEDESGPAYVFTVGLFHTFGHPEICILGLNDTDLMGQIVNTVAELINDGHQFDDWRSSDEVLDEYVCVFRKVGDEHYREYFGYGRWFYEGDDFPMLQCVWPDRNGYFPWEDGFESQLLQSQPVLATQSSWPFLEAKNAAVYTTRQVIEEDHPVLYVSHDEDGDWQFLCGTTDDPKDCRIVGLEQIVEDHPSVAKLADLRIGANAERKDESSPWERDET
ncbi:DUF4262 domain-containing protein [Stieleria sp. JC731]|uniref:DUF4262 domain-containing protein n=1 Tax=Pirellulaceae TaxID=2691357 RepID=UPI001E46D655|nr:DUF4262 domain-containing protein [Stieleria sp. JC731]MCC9601264.1 DUF4262 domain-containing protein [Stieleria sp. JC731]